MLHAQIAQKKPSELKMSREAFIEWYKNEPKTCAYCDIPEELLQKIDDLYNNTTVRLTIDRIDNDGCYEISNLVLACSRCNSIKSDLFDFDTMRKLAQLFIKPVWESKQ